MHIVFGLYRAAREPGSSGNASFVGGGVSVLVGAGLIFWRFVWVCAIAVDIRVYIPLYMWAVDVRAVLL